MALEYQIDTTDVVTISGRHETIHAAGTFTHCCWVYISAAPAIGRMMGASIVSGGTLIWRTGLSNNTSGSYGVRRFKTGSTMAYDVPNGTYQVGKWNFFGAVLNLAGGAGNLWQLYHSVDGAPAVRITPSATSDGTGTLSTAANAVLYLGNRPDVGRATSSYHAWHGFWHRALHESEIRDQSVNRHPSNACRGFWELGVGPGHAGLQRDESGYRHHGTPTGLVTAQHLPLRRRTRVIDRVLAKAPAAAPATADLLPMVGVG